VHRTEHRIAGDGVMARVDPHLSTIDATGEIPGTAGAHVVLRAARSPLVRRSALVILSAGGAMALAWLLMTPGHGFDFYAYWAVDIANPYGTTSGLGAFHYPPPFVWVAAPLSLAPFEVGYWAWTGLGILALAWLTRRWVLAWLLFPPVISELYHGNVNLFIAVGVVVGFRTAVAWGLVGMAKVTTGVVVIWPLLRGDWRSVGLCLATVALVALPTIFVTPQLWVDWLQHLVVRGGEPSQGGAEIEIPLGLRLVAAVALIAWGTRANRRWVVAPAVVLAMPILWVHSLAVLAALPRLLEARADPAHRT